MPPDTEQVEQVQETVPEPASEPEAAESPEPTAPESTLIWEAPPGQQEALKEEPAPAKPAAGGGSGLRTAFYVGAAGCILSLFTPWWRNPTPAGPLADTLGIQTLAGVASLLLVAGAALAQGTGRQGPRGSRLVAILLGASLLVSVAAMVLARLAAPDGTLRWGCGLVAGFHAVALAKPLAGLGSGLK